MTAQPVPAETRLLLAAALPDVAFDGWSDAVLRRAAASIGMDAARVRALLPRGAVDLAVASHRIGDEEMRRRLALADQTGMRLRERVALALRLRLAATPGREAVRRATALLALPHLAPTGAALVWATADAVWDALGDRTTDGNWYTKRATLSAVWASTIAFWLGDTSDGESATAAFIDRRIADVLRFEQAKARVPGIGRFLSGIRAPVPRDDLPGRWAPQEGPGHA
ncbi:MAG: COQ9 family protein [Rubellimicrobium sp.]|nr:COQ9 family protein [Rubellimicrobium sp.]